MTVQRMRLGDIRDLSMVAHLATVKHVRGRVAKQQRDTCGVSVICGINQGSIFEPSSCEIRIDIRLVQQIFHNFAQVLCDRVVQPRVTLLPSKGCLLPKLSETKTFDREETNRGYKHLNSGYFRCILMCTHIYMHTHSVQFLS